jgi:hypothetical protein
LPGTDVVSDTHAGNSSQHNFSTVDAYFSFGIGYKLMDICAAGALQVLQIHQIGTSKFGARHANGILGQCGSLE